MVDMQISPDYRALPYFWGGYIFSLTAPTSNLGATTPKCHVHSACVAEGNHVTVRDAGEDQISNWAMNQNTQKKNWLATIALKILALVDKLLGVSLQFAVVPDCGLRTDWLLKDVLKEPGCFFYRMTILFCAQIISLFQKKDTWSFRVTTIGRRNMCFLV